VTSPSPGGAAEFFEELRKEYLLEAPARLGEIRKDLDALKGGEPDAARSLKVRFHRLAGSGGSYGFPDISSSARRAELWVMAHPDATAANSAVLGEMAVEIALAFDRAAETLGLPTSAPKPAAFGWTAAVVGHLGDLADRVEAALADAQYTVRRYSEDVGPGDRPVSERPDVIVIVAGTEKETTDAVQRWTRGSPRPIAVLLVGSLDAIDPLRHPYSALDDLISPDRVETDLLARVRALGRSESTPRSVLIIGQDREPVTGLVRALEGSQVRVELRQGGVAARDFLTRQAPELIVVSSDLPDTTMPAIVRWIRRQPNLRLTPIVVSEVAPSGQVRLAAIRAGADDVVSLQEPAEATTQVLLARIERSRDVRRTAHRDDLTGLLNHEAMMEELDRALSLARRTNETLAFLTIDLDHFRRTNEEFGAAAGDAALIHVGRVIAGSVRSSDLIARMGGEEFGVLVRRCQAEDAGRVADKIQTAIRDTPCLYGGETIAVRVSLGVACHPEHGFGAAELLRAAERALAAAKAAGRDRTVVAS